MGQLEEYDCLTFKIWLKFLSLYWWSLYNNWTFLVCTDYHVQHKLDIFFEFAKVVHGEPLVLPTMTGYKLDKFFEFAKVSLMCNLGNVSMWILNSPSSNQTTMWKTSES